MERGIQKVPLEEPPRGNYPLEALYCDASQSQAIHEKGRKGYYIVEHIL